MECLVKSLSLMGYDAVNLGDQDFLLGTRFLSEMKAKYNIHFISANIFYTGTTKLFTEPYVIKSFNPGQTMGSSSKPFKVGILGLMTPRVRVTLRENDPLLEARDPVAIAEKMVGKLKKECDFIIVLAHLNSTQIRTLARQVNGIDVIIGGHDYFMRRKPLLEGETVIMQGGSKGQYIGDLKLTLDDNNNITYYEGTLVPLDRSQADDPRIMKLIEEYKVELRRMASSIQPPAHTRSMITHYVGEKGCLRCHPKQHEQWRSTQHARAYEALQRKKCEYDPQCLVCHTTGYAHLDGFRDMASTPYLLNVQCEACHGVGGEHVRRQSSYRAKTTGTTPSNQGRTESDFQKITGARCLKCHTKDRDPDFDFKRYKKKIVH